MVEKFLQEEFGKVNNLIWQEFLLWLKETEPDKEKETIAVLLFVSMFVCKNKQLHSNINKILDLAEIEHLQVLMKKPNNIGLHSQKMVEKVSHALNIYIQFLKEKSSQNITEEEKKIVMVKNTEVDPYSQVDFFNISNYAHTKPVSCMYKGQDIPCVGWNSLFVNLTRLIYQEGHLAFPVSNYSLFCDSQIDIGNPEGMIRPKEIAHGIYLETNVSATDIINKLRALFDICEIAYDDVRIIFVTNYADEENVDLSRKDSENRQSFSCELLFAATTIITEKFPNGFRKSSQIAKKKFVSAYKDITGNNFPEDVDIDALALEIGLEYENKIYVPSKKTKTFLVELVNDVKDKGCGLIYYEELYNAFSEELSADSIFSSEMLKIVLTSIIPEMVFYKSYMCFSRDDSLVKDIKNAYRDDLYLNYHEIKNRLQYVDLYQIRMTCSRSAEFVSMGNEVYALSNKICFSQNDIERAKEDISKNIAENSFSKLSSIDVYESECMNPGITTGALQSLLFDRYFSDIYSRKRSIITKKNIKIRVYDVMKEFCLEHKAITVKEIEDYERDVSGSFTYGLSAAFDNMIRVNKENFVHKDMVLFDVEATDYAISMYVQNRVFPLVDIKSFTSFPHVDGFPWNVFLLDSFCKHRSKKYRSIGGPAKHDIVGAIYPIYMQFENYTDLLAKAAADSGLELSEKSIGDYFSAHKYWLRKSKLNQILPTAQKLRLKED